MHLFLYDYLVMSFEGFFFSYIANCYFFDGKVIIYADVEYENWSLICLNFKILIMVYLIVKSYKMLILFLIIFYGKKIVDTKIQYYDQKVVNVMRQQKW